MENGQFQLYTGNGKGKTTAAVGLIVRAAGAGFKCYLGQFIKDRPSPEEKMLSLLPGVTVERYGQRGCILGTPLDSDVAAAEDGVRRLKAAYTQGYDLVVADEISVAWMVGLLDEDELLDLIHSRPSHVELVFTGRNAPQSVLKEADLITEMREVRHYYAEKGLSARKGID